MRALEERITAVGTNLEEKAMTLVERVHEHIQGTLAPMIEAQMSITQGLSNKMGSSRHSRVAPATPTQRCRRG